MTANLVRSPCLSVCVISDTCYDDMDFDVMRYLSESSRPCLHAQTVHICTLIDVFVLSCLLYIQNLTPRKLMSYYTAQQTVHEALSQCCFNVGPTSTETAGQHQNNIGSTYRVCWGCGRHQCSILWV